MRDDFAVLHDERVHAALVEVVGRLRVPEDVRVLPVDDPLLQRERHARLAPLREQLFEVLA